MSNEPASQESIASPSMTLDALAASQHVGPLESVDDLAVDLWDSDEELDRFLSAVREDRRFDMA